MAKFFFQIVLVCTALIPTLTSKNVLGQTSVPNPPQESYSSLTEAVTAAEKNDQTDRNFLQDPFIESMILRASDVGNNDAFGTGIAIDGDTAVVGVANADLGPNLTDRGAVYIFTRRGLTWSLLQKITASDGANLDNFGTSVSIAGDTIVVGAILADIGANQDQGAVYVFVRHGSIWIEQQKLTAADGAVRDRFGESISISGETILVGAEAHDVGTTADAGAAYVFTKTGGTWAQQAELLGNVGGQFGVSVVVNGDDAIIGAPGEANGSGHAAGAAYLFRRNGSTWTQQQRFISASPERFDGGFGRSVDIDSDTVVVGSPSETGILGGSAPGVVYVFVRNEGIWTTQLRLFIPSPANGSDFGGAVAIEHDRIVIGSPTAWTTINSSGYEGAAYIYVRQGTTWLQLSKMTASNQATFGQFGGGVDLNNGTVLIGATGLRATYVFLDTTNIPDLHPESDTGPSNTDNITNASNLIFDIPDITVGATVDLMRNGVVVASGIANSSSLTLADANPPLTGNVRYMARQTLPNGTVILGSPTVVSLNRTQPGVSIEQAPGQADPTGSVPINYRVQFDAPVTGFGTGSLSATGSTVNLSIANAVITGSGTTYNVAVNIGLPNEGVLRVSILPGAAQDEFGNVSSASTSFDNTVAIDRINDRGFELNTSTGQNPYWTSNSTRFGTALCTVAACGTGNGTAAPRTGNGWVWFDGSDNSAAEQGTAAEVVSFPADGRALLRYYLRVGSVNAPSTSTLQVKVDGAVVETVTEPPIAELAYNMRTVDLGGYADGKTHTISFQYNRPGGVGPDNFTIDDVSLIIPPAYVSGRVVNSAGRGIRNALVSITDGQGFNRTAMTNPYGFYSFYEILPDSTYTITVVSRRYRFDPLVLQVTSDVQNADFTGLTPARSQ